jgi:Flp pilus assembly protein TadD
VGRPAVARAFDQRERALALVRRAASLRRHGELRRAVVVLREACYLYEDDASSWALYGDLARRVGKREQAEHALKQALWLRERRGERGRAQTLRKLLLRVGDV